jgi:predicted transposase YdaD
MEFIATLYSLTFEKRTQSEVAKNFDSSHIAKMESIARLTEELARGDAAERIAKAIREKG